MEEITGSLSFIDVLCEELGEAARHRGIRINECYASGDVVHVSFPDIREAEEFVRLGVPMADDAPGSIYDRCTSSCVSLVALAVHRLAEAEATGTDPEDVSPQEREAVARAMDAGWLWQIHPNVIGSRVGWHSAVDLPVVDAQTILAHLSQGGE